jgi:hypothetical protein
MKTSMDFGKYGIATLSDVQSITLDSAVPTDIFFGNTESPQLAEKWSGVFNMGTGKLASVVSKGYQIIQHDDVRSAVCETLRGLGLEVKGNLRNFRDKFVMDLVFTQEGLEVKDGEQGIKLGIRVINSYNKSTSFRLEMFGFRMVCQNGMSLGNRQFGIVETTIHYGSKEKNYAAICKITELFVKRVMNSCETLQKYVDEMMADSMEYQLAVRVCASLLKAEKHKEEILSRLEGCKTRWDFYNAITNYATHGEALTPNVQAHMERLSQKVMTNSVEELKELIVEVPEAQ